jgi:hypothetical protein
MNANMSSLPRQIDWALLSKQNHIETAEARVTPVMQLTCSWNQSFTSSYRY